ncbi:hypothetical protein [Mycolicibacterium mengxianglii]|uniref:hypothetical protein n=1 Tax=Mycolicibacterium mengxianglii TaxID=2736649 RepID=UPI0018D052CF|nr:hypothetical protein [Mycolicibacterium mengxianglii]
MTNSIVTAIRTIVSRVIVRFPYTSVKEDSGVSSPSTVKVLPEVAVTLAGMPKRDDGGALDVFLHRGDIGYA